MIFLGVTCLLIVTALPTYYFYHQYQKSQKLLKNPTEAAKEEVKALIAKVGSLIELPTNEEPTIATVSDKEKVKDQPFFAKSENGDKVLIYTQGRKAILFRPSSNKIIEVAPINLGQPQEAPQASTTISTQGTQVKPVKIVLYNGTTTGGLTKTVEKQLKEDAEIGPMIEVVAKENAAKNDYQKTIVVDLTGSQKVLAENVATLLNGEVRSLPEGESRPNADLLVIIGK